MLKMMKKVQALIIAVVLILSGVPVAAEQSTATDAVETNVKELLYADFENGTQGFSGSAGTVDIVKDSNSMYGNTLKLTGTGEATSAFFVLDEPVSYGKLVLSYDMKYSQKNVESYMRVFRNAYTAMNGNAISDLAEVFIVRNNGSFQKFNNMTWDVNGAPPMAYDADKWYHVDLWFDFDEKCAAYYVNGEPLGETKMADKIDKIQSFYHTISSGGECYLDNVHALAFSGGGVDMSKYSYIKYYPASVEQKIVTEFNLSELGHIYFTDDITGKVVLQEAMKEDFSGKLIVKMYGEDGRSVSCETDVDLRAGEKKEIDFTFKADKYGYYYLETQCIKNDGTLYGSAKTRLSHIVLNEESNPLMGYCTHISKGYGFDNRNEKLRLAKNVGADTIRDELRWTDVEVTPGVFKYNSLESGMAEAIRESGMRFYCILGYGLPSIYPNEKFPVSETMINDFMEYVEYAVESTKDMDIDFEFWNELNMQTNPLTNKTYEQEYTHLLKLVYQKIKSINPNAKVYAMVTANTANASSWIEECLKLGAGEYIDGISIHPYNVTLSAEAEKTSNDIKNVQDLMVKYGIGDKSLVLSEFGWSSSLNFADEEKQANYMPEFAGIMTDRNIERILWYNLQEKTTGNMSDGELHFGSVRGWQFAEIPYEAKPAFLTVSAYNKLMNGAKKTGQISMSDENASVYTFDLPDGKKAVMAWSKQGSVTTALNFGTETILKYDRYGNEEKLCTRDGITDVYLTEKPVYFIGDIDTANIKEEEPKFEIFGSAVNAVSGDTVKVSGRLPNGDWSIETVCPDNIAQRGDAVINRNGEFELNFDIGNNEKDTESLIVAIKDKTTGNKVYTKKLDVNYKYSLDVESAIKYYRNSRWKLVLRVHNNKSAGSISGKIHVTQPSDIILGEEAVFENLEPGNAKYIYINIPPSKSAEKLDVSGYVKTDTGEQIPFEDSSYFVGMTKIPKEPVIDGKIETGEYSMETPVKMNKENMVQQISDWGGVSDLSGTVYLNFDSDYFYLAAKVRDNAEGATGDASGVWRNDSVQFAFAERALSSAERTEIGIGKDKDGKPAMYRYSFLGTKFFAGEYNEAVDFDERCRLEISREGDITTYELRMPWVDIYGDDGAVFAKRSVLFCILINDNDGSGRRGWIELCPGIGGAKNAAQFMKVPVMQ